jgi:hypothetical protein
MEPGYYQKKARECVWATRRVNDPGERLNPLTVAHQFALLAAHVSERPDRATNSVPLPVSGLPPPPSGYISLFPRAANIPLEHQV